MDAPPVDFLDARARSRLGVTLRERYRIERLLGIGGMGAVYAGHHRNGHPVAIKVLHERLIDRPDAQEQFRREARLSNSVKHPAVVPVIDDDVAEDGCVFLVMPLLDGETLRARWERSGRRLSVDEVVKVTDLVLDALAAAHTAKIVHRDVKPENVFITRDGAVRLLDFGIARLLDDGNTSFATRTGHAIGTPAFMAPEQALGRSREIDARTDLWAVGAMMFSLISSRLIHEAETPSELVAMIATRPPRRLADVAPEAPVALCGVIDRALAFNRIDRWATAEEMRCALVAAYEAASGKRLTDVGPLEVPTAIADDAAAVRRSKDDAFKESGARVSTTARLAGTTRTAPPPPAAAHASRRRRLLALLLGTCALIVASAALYQSIRARSPLQPSAGTVPDATPYVDAARKAWLGAGIMRFHDAIGEALKVDPNSVSAGLAVVRSSLYMPNTGTRKWFIRVQDSRSSLPPKEQAYVDAIAPAMSNPANFRLAVERLLALHAQEPQSVELAVALAEMQMQSGDYEGAVHALEPLAAANDAPAIVLARLGHAYAMRDDNDSARAVLSRCTGNYPAAAMCMFFLSAMELHDGHCESLDRLARQMYAAEPTNHDGLNYLADALYDRGASSKEVRPVLARAMPFTGEFGYDGDERAMRLRELALDSDMLTIDARLRDAIAVNDTLEREARDVAEQDQRWSIVLNAMLLKIEVGDTEGAAKALDDFVASRHALQPNVNMGDDLVAYLESIATEFGVVSWRNWRTIRDQRLRSGTERADLADARQRLWLELYALPATTPAAANEALAVLPEYLPLLRRLDRWFWFDGAIGRVYALAGRDAEAHAYFDRAINSCGRLAGPIQYLRVQMDYAGYLEGKGEVGRACSIYSDVIARWPVDSGSLSAVRAANRLTTRCHHVTAGR